MITELVTTSVGELQNGGNLEELGQAANHVASQAIFDLYRERKSDNTLRRQGFDLTLFEQFIRSTGAGVGDLMVDPMAWRGITWGLVTAFRVWMLGQGFAVTSVNVRISTIKTYAKLAFLAGVLDVEAYTLIRGIENYRHGEIPHIDKRREVTRVGGKKGQATTITDDQAKSLKVQPDTEIGRRDRLMMHLFLDHGLRASEVEGLKVADIDLPGGVIRFYRPKVDKTAVHKLTRSARTAAEKYLEQAGLPGDSPLFPGQTGEGLRVRSINKRVGELGRVLGIDNLSPHDCRHYLATKLAKTKGMRELMDIFGWTSPAMAARYIESAEIADVGD